MTWTWRLETSDGSLVAVSDLDETEWSSQADAETWIGENWPILLAAGVDQVVLLEDGQVSYGPMSLHPPTAPEPS
jgi:hypothetical protein